MDVICDLCFESQRDCPGEMVHCIVYGVHCIAQDAGCAASFGYTFLGSHGDHPEICCICKEKL